MYPQYWTTPGALPTEPVEAAGPPPEDESAELDGANISAVTSDIPVTAAATVVLRICNLTTSPETRPGPSLAAAVPREK